MAGGPRPEETVKWAWREQVETGTSAAAEAPAETTPEGGEPETEGSPAAIADAAMKDSAEIVPPTVSNGEDPTANDQDDVGARLLDDLTTLDGAPRIQAPLLPEGNRDDLRVMKKRRVAQPALQHERDPELAWALRGPADQGELDDLPNPAAFANTVSAGLGSGDGATQDGPSAARLGPGKTVIRALGEKRDETWSSGPRIDGTTTKPRPRAAVPTAAGGNYAAGGRVAEQQQDGDSREGITDLEPVFAGQTMALMGLQGPNPDKLARVIKQYGGTALVDASPHQIDQADWIVVDHVE